MTRRSVGGEFTNHCLRGGGHRKKRRESKKNWLLEDARMRSVTCSCSSSRDLILEASAPLSLWRVGERAKKKKLDRVRVNVMSELHCL